MAYVLAAVLSGLVGLRARGREKVFWLSLFVILVGLSINKQLDLQSALTATGRCIAQFQGWFDQRRAVQKIFVVVMAVFSVSATLFLFWWMKDCLRRNWLALLGLGILITFILIRAAGIHHIDALVTTAKLNGLLELSGIAFISLSALRFLGRDKEGSL